MTTTPAQSTAASDYLSQVSSRLPAGSDCELLLQEFTVHVNDVVRESPATTTEDLYKKFGAPEVAAKNLVEASVLFPTERTIPWARIIIAIVIAAILVSLIFVFTLRSTDAPSQPAQTTTVSASH